ncbi:hypothetical protein ACPF04_11555, partial [Campylobacter sp. MOP51]|uniref:hypothetical protein n=1 Tax=Campylobacter canis TaxID=3378588 RepID=UPI003C560082
ERYSQYKDINSDINLTKRQTNSVRVFGDVETIGATIMVPQHKGFDFEPDQSNNSVIRPFRLLNEERGIPNNSAKASFKFDNDFVAQNLTGKEIILARLY